MVNKSRSTREPTLIRVAQRTTRSFGVEYHRVRTDDGGELFVTRFGWPVVEHLLPHAWYHDRYYATHGQRLPGSTGRVYRVPTRPVRGRSIDIVAKFSRVAQEVPLEIATDFPDEIDPEVIANARFNSPFEEFGLLMEMRSSRYGNRRIRVRTQRPLAIFVPPESSDPMRLGRSHHRFNLHQHMLRKDQEGLDHDGAIELDIKRKYVLIFNWIKGEDAEAFCNKGWLGREDLAHLTPEVIGEMRDKGFRVLDNKPKHFILRQRRRDRELCRRNGKLVYAVIDFELLQRTEAYKQQFKISQRSKYWHLQRHAHDPSSKPLPEHLYRTRVLGVDYVFGIAPNGGHIWVVGNDPDLFDYFQPDRWRRTPRMKLSVINDVYYTRSRDNIYMIYRRSRVGEKPYADPFYEPDRRIRDCGVNSPFEEVAIAERLRASGMSTTHPRAIYRTAHESAKMDYLRDNRRYQMFEKAHTPTANPEPILSANHDYFTIWGYWRGIDLQVANPDQGPGGYLDVDEAFEQGLLTEPQHQQAIHSSFLRLERIGLAGYFADHHEFLLQSDGSGSLRLDEHGGFDVTLTVDALSALDAGLLTEPQYRQLLTDVGRRLEQIGFEAIHLQGHDLLLSINPDGEIRKDGSHRFGVTLCNFELMQAAAPNTDPGA